MRRPPLTVIVWLIGVIFCVIVIALTRFTADMSAFLPRSPSPTQQILVDQMQTGVASHLILAGIEGAPVPALAALSRDLAKTLRQNPAFVSISNGEEGDITAGPDGAWLWRNRYLLSPNVTPDHFSAAGIQQALEGDLQLLASNLEGVVKQTLPADPTNEFLTVLKQFAGQAQPARQDGVWFSPDGKRALLVLQTRNPGFDIATEETVLATVDTTFLSVRQTATTASAAQIVLTGPGVFAVHTKNEMKEDISRLSLIATLLVAAILLFTYRSPLILVLALVPVASGALAGIAAVSIGFGFVHGITLGFGITLIGEAVDYAIYLFTQTAPGTSTRNTLPRIWPMLQLGVLVSVCGFSAMLFSSFTGFAQLGLFSITGLIVAVAVTRWVLPALVPQTYSGARTTFVPGVARFITDGARRLHVPALLLVIAAIVALALHRGSFWEDDLTSLSPIPASDQALDRSLRDSIGAPDVRYLIVASAPDEQQALADSERLSILLDDLTKAGIVSGFDAPTRYLPSDATQRVRLDALPETDVLRARVDAALQDSLFNPDVFAPFIADVAAAKTGPLLDRAGLQGSSLALKLDSLLLERQGGWTALLSLRGVTDASRVTQAVAQLGIDGVTFVDLKAESDRLLLDYRREALMLALIGSLVIVLLLAVSLRSPRRVALVVAPLGGAVLLTTAILTLGGHQLSIFNLVGLLLTVAVGSNYCIFFERQDWNDPGAERMVASLVLANLCTVIGFGILSFARLPVLHGIGTTVAIGAFLSLIFGALVASSRRISP